MIQISQIAMTYFRCTSHNHYPKGTPCCLASKYIAQRFVLYCNYYFLIISPRLCVLIRDVLGNVEVMQLDFEMENFTSLSVTRRINWNIDYKGQGPSADSEKVVTELTVVQRDIQAILPLAMVSAGGGGGEVWRGGWIYADL